MERRVFFGTSNPGSFADLVDLFVEQNLKGALEEPNQAWRDGLLGGLQACTEMRNGDLLDFELAVMTSGQIDRNNHALYNAREMSSEDCYRHRAATVQLVRCHELLRVACFRLFGQLPTGETRALPSHAVEYHDRLTGLGETPAPN